MIKSEIEQIIKEQLAIDFNCDVSDFLKEENVITLPSLHEKRRKFSEKPFFLQMLTFGNNTIISADEKLHPWLTNWVKGKSGFWLFEQHNFFELQCEVKKYGYKMELTHHMFVPKPEIKELKTDLSLQYLEQKEIQKFYGKEEFSNAICESFKAERPDMLAIIALDGENIMGMAGCTADTPKMWQIGIDVLPQYRGCGVGTTLVTLLKNEIIKRGAIPYYGTSLSNINSWRIAIASGFVQIWIEVEAREDVDKAIQNN